jgi:hypothetical protein
MIFYVLVNLFFVPKTKISGANIQTSFSKTTRIPKNAQSYNKKRKYASKA